MKISNNLHWPWRAGQLSFRGAVKRNHELGKSPDYRLQIMKSDISPDCVFIFSLALHLPKHEEDNSDDYQLKCPN